MLPRIFLLTFAALAALALDARAIVYRSDETDATALGLANQPQFSGTGIVVNGSGGEQGTGEAIAANWILTAKHVVTGYTTATFKAANGQNIAGTVYTDANSDMALIKLNSNLVSTSGQSFTPIAFITPNLPGASKVQPVGPLIWNVGYGNYGNYGGTINNLDDRRRAGTNNVDSYSNPYLVFNNGNTGGTEFEATTGAGDSGGPMFLQNGYQWLVVGEVLGAQNGVGFLDTDLTLNNFITSTTGLSFAPQAAPTSLAWNSNHLSPSTAASKNITNKDDGGGTWNTTRLNFFGASAGGDTYTYAWQNGTLLPVTFGVGSGTAGTVTLGTPINISNLTFAATGSGNYTIAGTGTNSLTLQTVGSTITTNVAATISAPMVGAGSSLVKAGTATLTVSGANTYTGGTTINAGTLLLSGAGTLGGTSGALVLNNAGSTLNLGGTDQAVGGFTGDAGTVVTNSGASESTLTVGTGNAGASPAAFKYAPGAARHQYRTFVSATGAANVFAGVIQDGTSTVSLAKVGTGTITLAGANTYSGGTTISGGTLALSGSGTTGTGALTFNGTGSLNLGGNTRTVSTLAFGTNTAAFTGSITNGSLTVTGASGFNALNPSGTSGTFALDLSGLTNFTYNQSAQLFAVGGANGGGNIVDVQLAGANTITANSVQVGTGSTGTFNTVLLHLGTSNTIQTNTVQLGQYRVGSSTLDFQSGLTNATVSLRGTGGGVTPVGSVLVNLNQNGAATTGKLDLSGGTVDAIVTNFTVGAAATNGSPTTTVTMGAGKMNVGTLALGYSYSTNTTANTTASTFNQNAGTVLANTLTFATRTGSLGTGTTATDTINGTYNLGTDTTAGVLAAATIAIGTSTDNAASRQVLNFNGGIIRNYDPSLGQTGSAGAAGGPTTATDLIISGITGGGAANNNKTLTINLVGTDTHTFSAGAGHSIAVTGTALITGAGSLTKAGPGTLTLAGTVSHTGATAVNAGAMFINGTMNGTSGVTVAAGGTLGGSGTINTSASNGAVTLAATGKLAPGAAGAGSVGILTFTLGATGTLNLSAATAANNGALVFDLGTTAASDLVRLTSGTFNLGTGALGLSDFVLTTQAGFGAGTYTLLTGSSAIDQSVLDSTDLSRMMDGYTETLSDTGTSIVLLVSVPEPGTWAMLAVGVIVMLGARRYRWG